MPNNRREHLAHLNRVMSDPQGREYLYDLLASLHIYSTSFSTDALIMAFNEGQRNVGIRLTADLVEASPDMYLQMLKEFGNVRQQGNRRAAGTDPSVDDPHIELDGTERITFGG